MSNIIQYGQKLKKTVPFFGDLNIIQQFSIGKYQFLQKLYLYIALNNCNHDYKIKTIIVDQEQNLYFTKQIYLGDVFTSDFYQITVNTKLQSDKNYFLCLDSYGNGDLNNNVSFYLGYRKHMMNFFFNNQFSLGQLYFKMNVK